MLRLEFFLIFMGAGFVFSQDNWVMPTYKCRDRTEDDCTVKKRLDFERYDEFVWEIEVPAGVDKKEEALFSSGKYINLDANERYCIKCKNGEKIKEFAVVKAGYAVQAAVNTRCVMYLDNDPVGQSVLRRRDKLIFTNHEPDSECNIQQVCITCNNNYKLAAVYLKLCILPGDDISTAMSTSTRGPVCVDSSELDTFVPNTLDGFSEECPEPECEFAPQITIYVTNAIEVTFTCYDENGSPVNSITKQAPGTGPTSVTADGLGSCYEVKIDVVWIPDSIHSVNDVHMDACVDGAKVCEAYMCLSD